jgi:hypothetical protein
MITIREVLDMNARPEGLRRPPPKRKEVLPADLKERSQPYYAYQDEVFAYLCENRKALGIESLYQFNNQAMDGELLLHDGTSVPIEIKFRMNWLKACQANWQFARFLGQSHKPVCKVGIVFFQEFSGDWARTAKSRPIQNGWLRWYLEHHEIGGLQFHLVRLQDGKAETYSEVVSRSLSHQG